MEFEHISSDYNLIYFIRGHVDLDQALAALKDEDPEDFEKFKPPKHAYFRVRPDNTGEYRCWYYEVNNSGIGAFPVTMMSMDW